MSGVRIVTPPYLRQDLLDALPWAVLAAHDQYVNPMIIGTKRRRVTDQHLFEAVTKGSWSATDLKGLCTTYKVFRGPWTASGPQTSNLNAIAAHLHKIYAANTPILWPNAGVLWGIATTAVRAVTKQNNRSLCMKAMWFYAPNNVTMWDSYAAKAIIGLAGLITSPLSHSVNVKTSVEARAFLSDFYAIYNSVKGDIQANIQSLATLKSAPLYPYERRVLDKALWFLSADKKRSIACINESVKGCPVAAHFLRSSENLARRKS